MREIVGYRLVEKEEKIQKFDVCGWAKKIPIDINLWNGIIAGNFN